MDIDIYTTIRIEALDRAVRVALATGGDYSSEETVQRATAFEAFLTGK